MDKLYLYCAHLFYGLDQAVRKKIILFCLLLLCSSSYGQSINYDSLEEIVASPISTLDKKEALLELAAQYGLDQPQKVFSYTDSLYKIEEERSDPDLFARIRGYEAIAHRFSGDFEESIRLHKLNYQYYKSKGDSLHWAYSADNIGTMKMFQGQYEACQQLYLEALDIYKALGQEEDIADMNNGLGNLYSYLEDYDKSISNYGLALNYYEEKEDLWGQSDAHANMGLTYISMKEYDKAEFHLLKEGNIDSLLESDWGLGFFHSFMGTLRQEQGRLEDARLYFLNSLQLRESSGSNYNVNETKIGLATLLNEMKKYNEAIDHFLHVIDHQQKEQSLTQQQSALEGLAAAYEGLGSYKNAFQYHQKFKTISDSIINKERLETILEKDAKYQRVEKDKEILELQLTDQLKSNQIQNQARWLGTLGIGIGLLGFLVYRLFSQKTQIKNQNEIISIALQEKDVLLREIHHRVKNNLQVISSLLRIQSSHTTDEVAIDALQEGQSRVQSMSLIHQDLYQKDNLTGIRMKVYLDRLIKSLFDTYNISEDRIQLQSNIENINLDVDTVIPLGLLINELITNSLKYAFPNSESGIIKINLREIEDVLRLSVADDGVGMPDPEKVVEGDSFGYSLIQAFVNKLDGELQIHTHSGTEVVLKISEYTKV